LIVAVVAIFIINVIEEWIDGDEGGGSGGQ